MFKKSILMVLLVLCLLMGHYTVHAADNDREPYIKTGTFTFPDVDKKGDIIKDYGGTEYGKSENTHIQCSGVKIEILNVENHNNYTWKVTYKATGTLYARVYRGQYSGSRSTYLKINYTQLQADEYFSNDHYQRYRYKGTERIAYVNKKNDRPMLLELSINLYAYRDYYGETHHAKYYPITYMNMNHIPVMQTQIDRNYMNGNDSNSITVTGKVWDIEQDAITVEAQIWDIKDYSTILSKHTKTIPLPQTTSHSTNDFEFTFHLYEFPNDFEGTIKITAKDAYGDIRYYHQNVYIDRLKPIVQSKTLDYIYTKGDTIRVSATEICEVYLLKNRMTYQRYADIQTGINSGLGAFVGTLQGQEKDLTVPNNLNGSYRLFAVDRGKNISKPFEEIIQIDIEKPELKEIIVDGNTLKFVYNDLISHTTSSANDLFVPMENVVASSVCILADEDIVDYEFIFDDYEGDEKYTDRFVFSAFDNSMFTNPNGIPDIIGQTASTKNGFHEVGQYTLEYQAQDTPVPNNENRFNDYRKWSNKNLIQLLVHRRPFANLTINASLSNYQWVISGVNGTGYDLDHMDMANKGIQDEMYEWKRITDSQYTPGMIPSTLAAAEGGKDVEYIVKYKVQDIEGAWSEPVAFIISADPPLELDASLKTEDSQFSISSIPASENLLAYEVKTIFNKLHYVDMALYNGSNSIVTGLIRRYSNNTSDVSQNGNKFYWVDKAINIPETLADGTYKVIIKATDASNSLKTDQEAFTVVVSTPVNLVGSIDSKITYDRTTTLTANTSTYVNDVKVTLYKGTSYERTSNLVYSKTVGNTKYWTLDYKEDRSYISEGNYVADFRATTPNGNWEVDAHNYYFTRNTPPTVNILGTDPSFIYEGDKVYANIQVNDVDLDTLTVTVNLSKDGQSLTGEGYPKTYTQSPNITNNYELLKVPIMDHMTPGNYDLHVLVDDQNGGTATDTTIIAPSPLSITGQVDHHPQWNDNRIKYNRAMTGKDDDPRTYDTYWAGERFMLSAQTTAIHADSRLTVSKVSVHIIEPARISPQPYQMNLSPLSSYTNRWSGELWDNTMIYRWGRPSPEDLTFQFTVYYSNGTAKQHNVTITIDDRDAYYKYHRKW